MTLAHIPTPQFESLHIGSLTIHMYAICILTGAITCVILGCIRTKGLSSKANVAHPLTPSFIIDTFPIVLFFALIGARLYYVITMWDIYKNNPISIFHIQNGGLGVLGGIVFGVLTAWIICRIRRVNFGDLLWCIIPFLPLAQAIGRLGNWFNGELYGTQTMLPWGLDISRGQYSATVFYHPTFLYEAIWDICICVLLLALYRKNSPVGLGDECSILAESVAVSTKSKVQKFPAILSRILPPILIAKLPPILPVYLCLYTFGRFWIELLRTDDSQYFIGLRLNLLYIGAIFFVSMGYLWYNLYKQLSKHNS